MSILSVTLSNPIDGKPEVIEKPLCSEHIDVGRLLWYHGFTSCFEWNCPAVITWVDKEARCFRVRSLDDMTEQKQGYTFDYSSGQPYSRLTMRLATQDEVIAWLKEEGKNLKDIPENVKQDWHNL